MSKKQVMKEIFNEKINKDRIYQNVLLKMREESNMNKVKNKKVFYSILSSCAVFAICAVVMTNNGKQVNENVTTEIKDKYAVTEELNKEKQNININKIKETHLKKIDADIKVVNNNINIPYYEALANLNIPKDFENKEYINIIYVKSDRDKKEYDKLFNYQKIYKNTDDTRNITIAYSKENKPMRDYVFENGKTSKINGFDIVIYQCEKSYITSFNYDNLNIDIETNNITQDELIALLESIIKEKNNAPVKDKDVNVDEQTSENQGESYPDYYAGKYVNSNGKNVILLCEDTKANRKDICNKLKITENKTIFKKAKYSYNYLTQLQDKISKKMINKEFSFVSSSAVMEDTNSIQVTVTSDNESDLSKIKALDAIGGAIDIKYSKSGSAKQDLLVEKE